MGMYPRIALFDYESMKKMVDAISVNMGAGEISYHGASVSNPNSYVHFGTFETNKSSSVSMFPLLPIYRLGSKRT